MPVDSLKHVHAIHRQAKTDSCLVTIHNKIWAMDQFVNPHMKSFYKDKVHSYLYAKNFPDSLFAVLDVYAGKVIQATFYFSGNNTTEAMKARYMQSFKLKELTTKAQNKTTQAYLNLAETGYSSLVLRDKRAFELMPSWCGNDTRKRSWEKLEKYLSDTKQ